LGTEGTEVAVLEAQLRVKDAQINMMQASIDRLEAKNTRKRKRLEVQALRIDTYAKAAKKSRVAFVKAMDVLKVRPRLYYTPVGSSHDYLNVSLWLSCVRRMSKWKRKTKRA
jgi:hypothetical protein